MTLIALVVAVTAGAQGTTIHEYPWNPDSNNDNLIGVDDLLDFLPVFGDEFGNPPEPCDYDGSNFEEFLFGINDGSIILDSIFVEYELEDISTYYVSGCPNPITDTLIFSQAIMLDMIEVNIGSSWAALGAPINGTYSFAMYHTFDANNGAYSIQLANHAIYMLGFTQDGFFGSWYGLEWSGLPLPAYWEFNEDGIDLIDANWEQPDVWIDYANYLHILPYWHYAE